MSLTDPAPTTASVPVPISGPVHPKHHAAHTPASGSEPRRRSSPVLGRAGPRAHRPDPRGPGHLRGQHRPADHRALPAPGQRRPAVAGHRLPVAVRRRPAARRSHRRPAAPPTGLPDRPERVHRRLAAQRLRRRRHDADRRPRRPGARRRADDPRRAVDHHDHLHRCPAHPRPRPVGRGRQPRHRRWRAARRSSDHLGRLAAHLLDQRPHRRRRPHRRMEDPAEGHQRPCRAHAVRPAGCGDGHRRAHCADVRPRRHRRLTAGCRPAPCSR